MGSCPGSCCKTLFGAVALLLVFICLLLIGMVELEHDEHSRKEAATTTTATATATATITAQSPVMGKENLVTTPRLNLNYMIKRRVPKGPDPIHNRRAGNSKRPPGQA